MGRVEDAMRRAADIADRRSQGTETLTGGTAPDLEFVSEDDASDGASVDVDMRPLDVPSLDRGPKTSRLRIIDRMSEGLSAKLVADDAMSPGVREQYRRLAATLYHAQLDKEIRVVMIGSAVASEGKTLTATNLALTLSESYKRSVLLIDADLRRPSVHTVFQIDGAPGLSEGLLALDHEPLPLHRVSQQLTILPAGRPSSDPMAGLTSVRMRRLIEEARETFEWVIIDTPPVSLMPDANLLAKMADGALLVVKANSTAYQTSLRAIEAVGRERFLGIVLNRATHTEHAGQKYYTYYYGPDSVKK